MAHSLIQIGNSSAIIIPARIVKKRNYTGKTKFDIIETSDGLRLVQKKKELSDLTFPRVKAPALSDKSRKLQGTVSFTPEEINQDDRLKHILSL